MSDLNDKSLMARRFRGFLPVVVDVETAGFNAKRDALLEIAAVTLAIDDQGYIQRKQTYDCHVEPFPGANLDQESLEFTGIDPYHPFRFAKPELEALETIFKPVRKAVRESGCNRAILVGHNSAFDLGFLNAAVNRTGVKRNPFHPFSTFDTVTLAGLAYGQTVLARAVRAAGIEWDSDKAHSAVYDTERTADLFCTIINRWHDYSGGVMTPLPSEAAYDEANTP
ncbi:MAG: ribonuclease T [Halobacteria archaeon]|nr:ribonuclease T [Halobacteria archaeon]